MCSGKKPGNGAPGNGQSSTHPGPTDAPAGGSSSNPNGGSVADGGSVAGVPPPLLHEAPPRLHPSSTLAGESTATPLRDSILPPHVIEIIHLGVPIGTMLTFGLLAATYVSDLKKGKDQEKKNEMGTKKLAAYELMAKELGLIRQEMTRKSWLTRLFESPKPKASQSQRKDIDGASGSAKGT